MKIELSKADCQNVKAAILVACKTPTVDENSMRVLLMLSDKFSWKEETKEEVKK